MPAVNTTFRLSSVSSKLGTTENKTHISSFGCMSEKQRALHGFAQQRLAEAESKPTKLAVNPPEFHLWVCTGRWMREGDQQYLKCTNCSRSVCTTCTVSTLELQSRQHVQLERETDSHESVKTSEGQTCATDTLIYVIHTDSNLFTFLFM